MSTPLPVVGPAEGAPATTDFSLVDADHLQGAGRAGPGFVWHGYLVRGGVSLLTGQWKAGKTTLVSVLLSKLQAGGMLAGLPVRPGRAAIVSEEPPELWGARHRRLNFGQSCQFICRPFRGRPTTAQWEALIDRLLARHQAVGLDLVVIDPLAAFLPGRTENHSAIVLDALLPLQRLTTAGVSVLVNHHPRKGEPPPGHAARGSGALSAFVDVLIEMSWYGRPTDDERRRKLAAYSRLPETTRRLVIELTADGTDYLSRGDFSLDDFDEGWQIVAGVLEDADGKKTRRQILDAWPQDFPKPGAATVWRWLDRAVKEGRVLKSGTGRTRDPFVYWLDGMEEVWRSDPFHYEPPPFEPLLAGRKTLAEVLAQRKGVGGGNGEQEDGAADRPRRPAASWRTKLGRGRRGGEVPPGDVPPVARPVPTDMGPPVRGGPAGGGTGTLRSDGPGLVGVAELAQREGPPAGGAVHGPAVSDGG